MSKKHTGFLLFCLVLAAALFALNNVRSPSGFGSGFPGPAAWVMHGAEPGAQGGAQTPHEEEAEGVLKNGETFFDLFQKLGLDIGELDMIEKASAGIYDIGMLAAGHPYSIRTDTKKRVLRLAYRIDDTSWLEVSRKKEGFHAEKTAVQYERRIAHTGGILHGNLVNSVQDVQLALRLADIFAWDIDFATDLRRGDTFKLVVEELYLDGEFKGFGRILSAEFVNDGRTYRAYRFEADGREAYYDQEGKSLQRTFLKAPLSYRRISSGYTKRRYHPILKIYRPHPGVDYAAPKGTPVSAVGDGSVVFAGYKGANGNLVVIKHGGQYKTYYGHLSAIARGIRTGAGVTQGQVIGRVGMTGMATGPHLDYRVKHRGHFVNPLTLDMPRRKRLSGPLMAAFRLFRENMDALLNTVQPDGSAVARAYPREEKTLPASP
jgi:murein DD-endopeptidase MepM/ murein hydrolase activator NlpD